MWESAKTVAPTPNFAIIQRDVDDNFVINSTHLNMIRENKFDGYLRADPHDHIREFLAICNMFRYGKTQSEAVKLMIFPLSLSDEAKTWFNELNEESITSWEQMRKAFINRFFPPSAYLRKMPWACLPKGLLFKYSIYGLDEPTQAILDITVGGIFLYKIPNQAFQFLEDKVLFKLDWSIKSQNNHHQISVAFTDGSDSNTDNSRLMEKLEALTIKIDSQIISLNEELGKENGLLILQSINQGPFELGTTRNTLGTTPEGGVLLRPERPRTYEDLSDTGKKRYMYMVVAKPT
ncbi:reverse transcriptase domain-containing protein [Tanacetum coccineum]